MNENQRIGDTEEAWDDGTLGRDEAFVAVAPEITPDIDESLGLQPISIRLERSLIDDFKLIAELNGLGYQPLMRTTLKKFADSEKRRVLQEIASQRAEEKARAR